MAKRIQQENYIKVRRINRQWCVGYFSEEFWEQLEVHNTRSQANLSADLLELHNSDLSFHEDLIETLKSWENRKRSA